MMTLKPMGTPGKCPAHERAWTPEEEELVISLYRKKSLTEIAALLPAPGRSADAVAHKLQFLRERFPDQIGYMRPRYTQEQDNFIRKNCHMMTAEEIGNQLTPRRTRTSVMHRARRLGIRLYKCGDNSPHTKYEDEDVELIRGLRDSSDLTFREIDGKFAIDKDTTRWLYYHSHTAIDAIVREYLPR